MTFSRLWFTVLLLASAFVYATAAALCDDKLLINSAITFSVSAVGSAPRRIRYGEKVRASDLASGTLTCNVPETPPYNVESISWEVDGKCGELQTNRPFLLHGDTLDCDGANQRTIITCMTSYGDYNRVAITIDGNCEDAAIAPQQDLDEKAAMDHPGTGKEIPEGKALPQCRRDGERCIGAPGHPFVPWIECCDSLRCETNDTSEDGYGFVCSVGITDRPASKDVKASQCRRAGESCMGGPGQPLVQWIPCCDEMTCGDQTNDEIEDVHRVCVETNVSHAKHVQNDRY